MSQRHSHRLSIVLFILFLGAMPCYAEEAAFPLLRGLESAVEFWKQIFTRYGSNEVVFHDPLDPTRIYSVVAIPENEQARALIDRERARIIADFDLREEDNRVRAQRGIKERFLSGLKASGRYLRQMQKIFRDEGVPVDLTYLPLVESSFNLHARSSAGAVGMWQFMPETAKKFMRVNKSMDERKDPVASSRAAARLLKENYKIFGNWPLAVTAYNHGTEGIQRGVSTVESDNLVDIIRGYQSPTFGFASKNFYAEFLAAVEIAKNSDAYLPALQPHDPIALHEVEIKRPISVQSLLKPAGISQAEFFAWNPALNPTEKKLPPGYRLKVPPEKADRIAAIQRQPVESTTVRQSSMARESAPVHHRVSEGETLSKIAKVYRVSIAAIQKANGLGKDHSISVGQRLKIPKR